MRQIETSYRAVPAGRKAGARFSSVRAAAHPEFLGDLLSDRQSLAAQRQQRRASPLEVLRTYDKHGRLTVVRMPPGYAVDFEA